jgi:hypothetical protein
MDRASTESSFFVCRNRKVIGRSLLATESILLLNSDTELL